MTDYERNLQDGEQQTIRRGTKPHGGWKNRAVIDLKPGDKATICAGDPNMPCNPPAETPPPTPGGSPSAPPEITGGTGGEEFSVSTFAALKTRMEQLGPRYIKVTGSDTLDGNGADIDVRYGDMTVDGSAWTGVLKDYRLVIRASNIVITEMAMRPGEGDTPTLSADRRAISFNPGNNGAVIRNLMLYKNSFAWGPDVVASWLNNCEDVWVEENIFGPCLYQSNIPDGGAGKKGYGPNVTVPGNSDPDVMWGKRMTFYRNLYIMNRQRNLKFEHTEAVNAINNVIYDWGNQDPVYGNARGENIVGNMFKKGPETQASNEAFEEDGSGAYPQYDDSTYQTGNIGITAAGGSFTLDWSRIDAAALLASPYGGSLSVTPATANGTLFTAVVAAAGRTHQDTIDTLIKGHATAGTSDGYYNGAGFAAPHPSWP